MKTEVQGYYYFLHIGHQIYHLTNVNGVVMDKPNNVNAIYSIRDEYINIILHISIFF